MHATPVAPDPGNPAGDTTINRAVEFVELCNEYLAREIAQLKRQLPLDQVGS
jgi:hypothetical protein